jgi:hypothetical protein
MAFASWRRGIFAVHEQKKTTLFGRRPSSSLADDPEQPVYQNITRGSD